MADKGNVGFFATAADTIRTGTINIDPAIPSASNNTSANSEAHSSFSPSAFKGAGVAVTATITGATASTRLHVISSGGAAVDVIYSNGSGVAYLYDVGDGTYYVHDLIRTKTWSVVVASGVATVTEISTARPSVGFVG